MTVNAEAAAKYLARLSGWRLSNLKLQKILYLADLYHTGTHGERLVDEDFEAWDYGPVLPSVYHLCKYRGSKPVPEEAFLFVEDIDDDSEEARALRKAWEALRHRTAGELVGITHWCGGAWHKRYQPGARGIRITTQDMREEWEARMRKAERKDETEEAVRR